MTIVLQTLKPAANIFSDDLMSCRHFMTRNGTIRIDSTCVNKYTNWFVGYFRRSKDMATISVFLRVLIFAICVLAVLLRNYS